MQRIILLQEGPDELEVAVLKLSSQEHTELQDHAVDFFNKHQVFGTAKVRKVQLQHYNHERENTDCMVISVHYPHCMVVGTCAPKKDSSAKG